MIYLKKINKLTGVFQIIKKKDQPLGSAFGAKYFVNIF